MADDNVVGNGIKLVGEYLVTGASQMLEGEVFPGIVSFAVGTLGAALIAKASVPVAVATVVAVKADSYMRSIDHQGLVERLGALLRRETDTASSTAPATRAAPSRSTT